MVDYTDLFGILQEIRKRPSMWVHEKSLLELEATLHGYSHALLTHGIEEFGTDFSRKFCDYLWERFGWSMCQSWARGIAAHRKDSEEAFDRFFALVDDFHASEG